PKLNVLSLQSSQGVQVEDVIDNLRLDDLSTKSAIRSLIELFYEAKTFGSLIQVPANLISALPQLQELVSQETGKDMYKNKAIELLRPFVIQAAFLAEKYDCVVANPPYMGNNGMNLSVKDFVKKRFPNAKSDLFACFIERGFEMATKAGFNSMVTMQSWMFLSSYEQFRNKLLKQNTLICLAHFPYDGHSPTAMGINFGVAVISVRNSSQHQYLSNFCCARYSELSQDGVPFHFPPNNERLCTARQDDFQKIPGSPVAYWANKDGVENFASNKLLGKLYKPRVGMRTGDNLRFLRIWYEIAINNFNRNASTRNEAKNSRAKWFPFLKGGDYRKWFGNLEWVVNWKNDGEEIKQNTLINYPQLSLDNLGWKISNESFYFQSGLTWTAVSSSFFGVRYFKCGAIFGTGGSCVFPEISKTVDILGALTSKTSTYFMKIINPTLNINIEDVASIPILNKINICVTENSNRCIKITEFDWDSYETSWDFQSFPMLTAPLKLTTISNSYAAWLKQSQENTLTMKSLEEENNRLFIDAYGLQDELTPDVPLREITLTCNPYYRYSGEKTAEELQVLQKTDTMKELVSYAIGCMMGRYSLDEPGLIYAHSGNEGFDPNRYTTFKADDDGIIPLTDTEWFEDDATKRFEEFLTVAWSKEHTRENLIFVAESLGQKSGETPLDTIRRYLCRDFFKDHLKTYK
ncbi:BREX-1 system adenine-specific DNA-methyltransferase PglX, partial [Candidatus Magnetaquicoccus inordinatus]|uniref:BREX-1 system adenine-specific DNA-methyltransferase PglX n=1 Tax=Candidatus Magnetaquicoccus inordinatus TaxID=2496818 RepID=UPI00102C80C5